MAACVSARSPAGSLILSVTGLFGACASTLPVPNDTPTAAATATAIRRRATRRRSCECTLLRFMNILLYGHAPVRASSIGVHRGRGLALHRRGFRSLFAARG